MVLTKKCYGRMWKQPVGSIDFLFHDSRAVNDLCDSTSVCNLEPLEICLQMYRYSKTNNVDSLHEGMPCTLPHTFFGNVVTVTLGERRGGRARNLK
jgi:hypothetical protein